MSPLRWTLLALFVLAALVVASLTAEPSEWAKAVQWANQSMPRIASEFAGCPVLRGRALPGSPREHYERAARLAAAVDRELVEQLRAFAAGESRPAEGALAARDRLPAAALAEVRLACRVGGSSFDVEAVGRSCGDYPPFDALLALVDGLIIESQHGADAAVRARAWLDALACAVDVASFELPIASMPGITMLRRVADAGDDAFLAGLDEVWLGRVAAALASADAAMPEHHAHELSAVHLVRLLRSGVDLDPIDIGLASRMQAWRSGFSLTRDGIGRACALVADLAAFEDACEAATRWPARRQLLQRLVAADRERNSDMFFHYLGDADYIEEQRRAAIAALRILRVAVAHHAHTALPVLADPLGEGDLEVLDSGDGSIVCRSVAGHLQRRVQR